MIFKFLLVIGHKCLSSHPPHRQQRRIPAPPQGYELDEVLYPSNFSSPTQPPFTNLLLSLPGMCDRNQYFISCRAVSSERSHALLTGYATDTRIPSVKMVVPGLPAVPTSCSLKAEAVFNQVPTVFFSLCAHQPCDGTLDVQGKGFTPIYTHFTDIKTEFKVWWLEDLMLPNSRLGNPTCLMCINHYEIWSTRPSHSVLSPT